jgi:hypothetical protein
VHEANLRFGWVWILVGLISGTAVGIYFHDADWLGGYNSWRRRLVRLGHISFLGTGLLNLGFAFTVALNPAYPPPRIASWLFLLGAATMPVVCFLSAWKDRLRYLFMLPVASLVCAGAMMVLLGWR